ncbi:LexA family protein [Mucilaginibacter lacusdianchii]|uniref:LexA family protein n=1 Tax=Mucilaginibacter lacusdianchii TaxID=2684211 RepID=UPI00131E9441|nr:translesion error-prone DNA polymerase V autoproteolytic subunit [Mucilaginibacter sp. JXJ CY 39]
MELIHVYEPAPPGRGLPLAGFCIHAGFESPGTDYEEERISLDEYVTKYPHATYYIRVKGDCMKNSGIHEDDLLVVDKSLKVLNGDIVIGVLDGEHVLAVYVESGHKKYLKPDNPEYQPIQMNEFTDFSLEGVVSFTIHNQRRDCFVRAHRLQ